MPAWHVSGTPRYFAVACILKIADLSQASILKDCPLPTGRLVCLGSTCFRWQETMREKDRDKSMDTPLDWNLDDYIFTGDYHESDKILCLNNVTFLFCKVLFVN